MTTHDEFLNPDVPESADRASESLDAWTASLVTQAMHVEDAEIPREMMWARVRQQRKELQSASHPGGHAASSGTRARNVRRWMSTIAAVAATLVVGVAIGRYMMPDGATRSTPDSAQVASALAAGGAGATGALTARATDPAVIAMEEHFARTVALLTTVRDESPDAGPGADVSGWARELLGTTRMLLDEPQLRDDRTRRLLQDLELVLVQIIQARGTAAPEAKRAPSETMRETNLLPRVRAVVTASVAPESTTRGVAE